MFLEKFIFSYTPSSSNGPAQSEPFQMPLARLSLISTTEPFSSLMPGGVSCSHFYLFIYLLAFTCLYLYF